jgi:hypothetical protein
MAVRGGYDPFHILKMDCIVQGEWGFWTGGSTGRKAECVDAEGQSMKQGASSGCSVEERNWVRRRLFVPDESMAPDALEKGKPFFGCMLCRRFVCERQADVAAHIQSDHIEEGVQKSHEQACERDRLVKEGFSIDAKNKARTCKVCGFSCVKFYDARRHFESVHIKGGVLMQKKWRSAHNQSREGEEQKDVKKRKRASEWGCDNKPMGGEEQKHVKKRKGASEWGAHDKSGEGQPVGMWDQCNKSGRGKRACGVPAGVGCSKPPELCSEQVAEETRLDGGNIWSWVEYANEPCPWSDSCSSSQGGWLDSSCGAGSSPTWPESIGDGDFSGAEGCFGDTGLEPNVFGGLDTFSGVSTGSLDLGANVFGGLDKFGFIPESPLDIGANVLEGLDRLGAVNSSSCLGSANSVFWARQRDRVATGKTEFKFPSREDCLFYGEWNSFPRGLGLGN